MRGKIELLSTSDIQVTQTFNTLQEIVACARAKLPRGDWDFVTGGAETETTVKRNRLAFERLALKARVMNDVSSVNLRRNVFGTDLRIPVVLAPIGSLQTYERGGGLTAARAAETFGVIKMLSSACSPDYETVARECAGAKIYQLYVLGEESWMMDTIARTEAAGYKAFCLTVDTQVHSRRERDVLKGYVPLSRRGPDGKVMPGPPFTLQPSMTWELVKRIKGRFKIPLVLKGIACAEDAELAVQHGVEVIYVSNHGGRQLDQARGALDTLPEVVRAVAGRATIVVDGGVLRGTDILKALALGADAVGIGRLEALAMAAGGASAVVRMLELLENEMRINLALMGLSSIGQLKPECVLPADPVGEPHVLSGFPLLGEDY
ncbi:MAG: alpha-hydroxy-acid oxidizing protein [Betaproteobacteria bacterium]|nr:alpha-hydroxy-acid oxidizing protein [Betaproteobacteria bacterium]